MSRNATIDATTCYREDRKLEETLGERLRRAMRRTGVKNPELAAAAGVHVKTVSRWLSDRSAPEADALDRAAAHLGVPAAWLRFGDSSGLSLNGAPAEARAVASPGTISMGKGAESPIPSWPQAARLLVKEFELEAVRTGGSDEDVAFIRRALLAPEQYVLYKDGRPRDMTDEELLREMKGLMEGLRVWLRERIKRRSERSR